LEKIKKLTKKNERMRSVRVEARKQEIKEYEDGITAKMAKEREFLKKCDFTRERG